MKTCGATALAIDAQRTLLFDREELITAADEAGIAMQAFPAVGIAEPNDVLRGISKK
jgi:DUF1009 family protein